MNTTWHPTSVYETLNEILESKEKYRFLNMQSCPKHTLDTDTIGIIVHSFMSNGALKMDVVIVAICI